MIFIPYNTPSSKNSKRWTGRRLINSKTVERYIKNTIKEWEENRAEFLEEIKGLEKPYKIGLYFKRDSIRKFDYINIAQIVMDLMTKYNWIDDDNMTEVIPVFIGYEVDRKNPGVIITVIKD